MVEEKNLAQVDSKNGSQEDAALAHKIIKQVEYYFGDINLNKDKFMQEEIQKEAGWVSLDTLIKFNRLKQLSTDFQVIIDSLKQSKSELLEIDETNNKIRRAKPLPENLADFEMSLKQNTVYVKGFPNTLSLDELLAFFEPHGKVMQIFMRRFPASKQFKGSVFVTFETKEEVENLLKVEELKYKEQALIKESQEDYIKRKGPEFEKMKESKRRKGEEKEEKKKQRDEAEEAYLKEQKVSGAVMHIKGLGSEASRESIKELFDTFAKIRWVDFNKGQTEAFVRFGEENKAKEALEAALKAGNGELKLKDAKLEARVIEGEEEETYWKDLIKILMENKKGRGNSKRGGKKGGRGGGRRDFRNKRRNDEDGDDDDGEGANKKLKA